MSEPSPPQVQASGSKRKRSRRACEPCRRRKKKCDGREPCQLCQDYEYECTYAPEEHAPAPLRPSPHTGLNALPPNPAIAPASTLSEPTYASGGVFDARKGFHVDASSVLTFPRLLASSLETGQQPKLRGLVYNLGIREERYFVRGPTITALISLDDAQRFIRVFFTVVHPWHGYLEQAEFEARLARHYREMLHDPPFEMLVAFAVALGSYFSWPVQCPQEEELVERAISWMDRSILPDVTAQVCVFYAAAWITRVIYQRAASNPRSAWLSSCMAMHVCESMGLHKEWDSLHTVVAPSTDAPTVAQLESRRRIYWSARAVNWLVSTEYGRSSVYIAGANCKPVEWKPEEVAGLLIEAASLLPTDNYTNDEAQIKACIDAVHGLSSAKGKYVYIRLVRGDLACQLYRRLTLMNARMLEATLSAILTLGSDGVEAARTLASDRQPWWKVISTPFQFLCVLLSMDTLESLKLIPATLQALLHINEIFATQRTREAYEAAQFLVGIAQQKKERELELLRDGAAIFQSRTIAEDPSAAALGEAWADMDIDWMELMNPDLLGLDFGI